VSAVVTAAPGTSRSTAVTDALVAPPAALASAESLGQLRARLAGELGALVAELPEGEKLVLDDYHLRTAVLDPERCSRPDTFTPSPRTTRRAVGLAAVDRCVRGRSPAPATAVAEVLAAALEEQPTTDALAGPGAPRPAWWAEWYCGLGPGGRAMVEAEAVTWSSQLWTAVSWERFEHLPIVGGRDDWWGCPGARQLTLKGRAEVRVATGGRQALLVMANGSPSPGWGIELGFPALVAALARGERSVPSRVVGTWPSCGQLRVLEVDMAALEDVARTVVSATGTWVDAVIERH